MRVDLIRDDLIAKSFRLVKAMLFLPACSLLAACGLVDNNLSRHEYFAPMVGGDLTLHRKAYLCESTSSDQWLYTTTYSLVRLVVHDGNCSTMYQGTIIEELEVGTPLQLHRVYEPTDFNASGITAVGEISGRKFEYDWGGRMMPLYLAPWEKGPFDPNRCLRTIWEECKGAEGYPAGNEQD